MTYHQAKISDIKSGKVATDEKQLASDSISETIICEKVRYLHQNLLKKTSGTSSENVFKASRGWFEKFKK